jgi:endonuclease/exonuclease/phosphatase family metal-dependent hydrolase
MFWLEPLVEVETPGGPVVIADIHQMTARFGLKKLNRNTLINLDGTKELAAYVEERHDESAELRMIVDEHRGDRPMIVCGDFNVPSTSSLYQKYWGSLQNAFEVAGFGYGYTSPCKGNRFWPNNLPWARIDHILCTREFAVRQCQIGTSEGSDHRLIAATLVLKTNSR